MIYNRTKVDEFAKIDCGGHTFVGVFDPVQLNFIAGELVIVNDRFQIQSIGTPCETKTEVIKVISEKAVEWLTA